MIGALEAIGQRRSTRSFLGQMVADETLAAVLTAGQCAPYAGDQLCHITVVKNAALGARINLAAKAVAREMPMPHLQAMGQDEGFHSFYGAPVLILVSAREDAVAAAMDCAAVTENMLIAAEALDLGACWLFFPLQAFMGGEGAALGEALRLPEGYKPLTAMALGYRGAPVDGARDALPTVDVIA